MFDLVGNPEDRFSHNEAHIKEGCKLHGGVSMMVFFHDHLFYFSKPCLIVLLGHEPLKMD